MTKKKPAARKPRTNTRNRPQARARSALDRELEQVASVPGKPFKALKRPVDARFEAYTSEDGTRAEIDIYDVIGSFECNAAMMRQTLNQISASTIVVNINSPGGDVFDGLAMFADLRAHSARVIVRVQGLAASAASVIAMAGDEIEIAENGFVMIHNAWTVALGDQEEFKRMARLLGQIDSRMAKTYASRTGGDVEEIAEMMTAETWFDSEGAVDAGFADRVTGDVEASALAHDVSPFANAPAAVRKARAQRASEAPAAPVQAPEPEFDTSDLVAALDGLADSLAAMGKRKVH
jgi:ATP-dependent Clp protease protease subunit